MSTLVTTTHRHSSERWNPSWAVRTLRGITLALLLIAQPATAYSLPKPQLIAVYFWASWCPNCKALTPILDDARAKGELDKKDVLFVKLDLTDSATIHQSILLAQALGIAPYMQAQGSSTGYVAILDAQKKTELMRFDRAATSAQVIEGITKHLSAENK